MTHSTLPARLQGLVSSLQASGDGSKALTVEQLGSVISTLDSQIQAEVTANHEDLLQQLASLKDTEGVLSVVRAGADSLLASIQVRAAEFIVKQVSQEVLHFRHPSVNAGAESSTGAG